jgi:hyperosmotically inducible protein
MKRLMTAMAIALTIAAGVPALTQAQDRTIGQRVDDAKITAELKAKLTAQHAKNLVNVNVDTRNGVVHLEGMVPTERDRALAESLARDIKGVSTVHNELKVAVDPAASPRTR